MSSHTTSELYRQTSATDAAGMVSGFSELQRGVSKASRWSNQAPIAERRKSDGTKSEDEKMMTADGSERGAPASEQADVLTFPDGGLRAWLVVAGAFWTVFCGFGIAAGIGAFQTLYRSTFLINYSESQISWITSTQAFFTFGLACFTGALFDKFGHRPLIAAGTFFLVLGFCMLSLCTQYYQLFLVHATLIAWGCNLLFICPMGVLGQWFQKRRGLAFGIMSSGSSVGSVVWPLVLANLPTKIGFGWTCRVMALIALFSGICSFFLLKTRLPPKPPGAFFDLTAFKNFEYVCVCANYWTFSFGFFAMLTFIGTYGQLQGFGDFAPYLLIIQNGSSLVGRIGAGILADQIGVYNTVIGGCVVIAIMFWVWLACTTIPSCIVLVVIIGISSGAFISLQGPMATMTARDMRFGGTLVGQALFIQSFSQLICGPIFGAILGTGDAADRRRRFPYAIILAASMILISVLVIVAARWKRVGWQFKVKT